MDGEPRIFNDRSSQLEKYVADGNEVVEFKLVRTPADVEDDDIAFGPEMCHQIFSQNETIFGYEDLRVQLYFTAGSLSAYLGIRFKSKVSQALAGDMEPDNLVEKLKEVMRYSYTTNLDDFTGKIEKAQINFKPFGELLHSFTTTVPVEATNGHSPTHQNGGQTVTYEVYSCDISVPHFEDYLLKMETFILWFIDAASFVHRDDERWKFFIVYEKYKTPEGNTCYAFAGYSSVYNFYCYPDLIRPRVAQMLILPPFQRQGLAVELLSTIYRTYRNNPKVKEITVEDPSDSFERLRDFVDARDCSKLAAYAPDKLKLGYSKEMAEESKATLKMTSRQSRRVYEMLRLKITNQHDPKDFKEFRLDCKRRLNIPYQKQESDIKRMMRRKFTSTELQTQAQLDDASRKTELESNFQLLLSHYQSIVNRLDREV